jgi:hypothetical protein
MKITLKNSFHSTETYVLAAHDRHGDMYINPRQAKSMRTRLCGCADCFCFNHTTAEDSSGNTYEIWGHFDGGMELVLEEKP